MLTTASLTFSTTSTIGVRRGLLRLDAQLQRRVVRMLLATGAMGVALWLTQRALFAVELHGVARAVALAGLVGAGLVTYAAAVVVFGAADWRTLGRMVGRRTARRTGAGGYGKSSARRADPH